jgi:hypothetical protein
MLLNIRMITGSGQPRLSLKNNDWIVLGNPIDFESPPSGKRIYANCDNGDTLTIEFFVCQTRRQPRSAIRMQEAQA